MSILFAISATLSICGDPATPVATPERRVTQFDGLLADAARSLQQLPEAHREDYRVALAAMYAAVGDDAQAVEQAALIHHRSSHEMTIDTIATVYGDAGRFSLAELWLNRLGGTAHGWRSLAQAAIKSGDLIAANRCVPHAGEAQDRGSLLLDLALLARRQQHYRDEKSFLDRAIKELEPCDCERALIDRTAARLLNGDKPAFEKAVAWLGQFQPNQKPAKESFVGRLADRWLECGLLDAAVLFLQKAGFPDNVRDVPVKVYCSLIEDGRTADAQRFLELAPPSDRPLWRDKFELALLQQATSRKQLEDAERHARLIHDPAMRSQAFRALGEHGAADVKWNRAIDALENSLEAANRVPDASEKDTELALSLAARASACNRATRSDEAIRDIKRSVDLVLAELRATKQDEKLPAWLRWVEWQVVVQSAVQIGAGSEARRLLDGWSSVVLALDKDAFFGGGGNTRGAIAVGYVFLGDAQTALDFARKSARFGPTRYIFRAIGQVLAQPERTARSQVWIDGLPDSPERVDILFGFIEVTLQNADTGYENPFQLFSRFYWMY